MTPLRPLPGDPGGVRHLASALGATGARLSALAATLVRLRDGATWEGCAGEAFGARIGDVPPVVQEVADRFRGAVAPLLALAEAMEEAQQVVGHAVRVDDEAAATYAALEDRVVVAMASGSTEDDPDVLVVRHLQRRQVEDQQEARARHAAALERFRVVDERTTRALRALALDDLADSAPYRLLAAVSSGGRDLATVGTLGPLAPELVPVAAVADGAATLADGALLLAYDEGDAGELATSLLLASTAGIGGTLRRGAAAGAEVTATGARVTRPLTTRQRLALGAAASVRARRDAVREALEAGARERTPSVVLGGPPVRPRVLFPAGTPLGHRVRVLARQGAARVRESAEDVVRRRVLDDWARASANGVGAQRMYVSGVTLQLGTVAGVQAVEHARSERDGGGR